MRISDWSSDVCSSDLIQIDAQRRLEKAGVVSIVLVGPPVRGAIILRRGRIGAEPGPAGRLKRIVANELQGLGFRIVFPVIEREVDAQIGRASRRERVCQYV